MQTHAARVDCGGPGAGNGPVDRITHTLSRCVVRLYEQQVDRAIHTRGGRCDSTLDQSTFWNRTCRGVILLHQAARLLELESADGERALRDRIRLAIGADELGEQQRATGERARVTRRGDIDIEVVPHTREGRQARRDQHRGNVATVDRIGRYGDPKLAQQVRDGLTRSQAA